MFYALFFIGWFILVARNFYIYRLITGPIKDFVNEERTVGDFSFTIGNMLEFFLILFFVGANFPGVFIFCFKQVHRKQ
jgi:hypothetical protein